MGAGACPLCKRVWIFAANGALGQAKILADETGVRPPAHWCTATRQSENAYEAVHGSRNRGGAENSLRDHDPDTTIPIQRFQYNDSGGRRSVGAGLGKRAISRNPAYRLLPIPRQRAFAMASPQFRDWPNPDILGCDSVPIGLFQHTWLTREVPARRRCVRLSPNLRHSPADGRFQAATGRRCR